MKKNTFKSCFSLKRHDASAYAAARLCTLIIALFLSGNEAAKAQFQLLPEGPPPVAVKPVVKPPREQREAATKGDFPRRLKREEIEAIFVNNKPFAARGLGRTVNFTVTLFTNGAAERINLNDSLKEAGLWRWLGDGYCSKWGKSAEGCFSVVKDGEIYKIVRNTRAVAFWTAPAENAKAAEPPELAKPDPLPKKKKAKKT